MMVNTIRQNTTENVAPQRVTLVGQTCIYGDNPINIVGLVVLA